MENFIRKRKSPSKPDRHKNKENTASLVDPVWEVLDPNPNIHSLFQEFDRKYFWSTLGAVEVKWSRRMTLCAGTCTYKGAGGCIVALSLPLLKLRPRKDLIETLLHEMIHAYLFLTKRDRNRQGHGPNFHKHMHRINDEAGTKISVYHSFHNEVRLYKTHVWRCDGPCRDRKPYFGILKRATNRAPGPNDQWWAYHQAACGGTYIKIEEPEGYKSKKDKKVNPKDTTLGSIANWLSTSNKSATPIEVAKKPDQGVKSHVAGFQSTNAPIVGKVAGTGQSNIHGFGKPSNGGFQSGLKSNKGGTVILNPKNQTTTKPTNAPKNTAVAKPVPTQTFSGTGYKLGGTSGPIDRSNSRLLQIFAGPSRTSSPPPKKPKANESGASTPYATNGHLVPCPVCRMELDLSEMNGHLDSCVQMDVDSEIDRKTLPPSPSKSLFVQCPVCGRSVYKTKINEHVDTCVESYSPDVDLTDEFCPSTSDPPSPDKKLFASCPVCNQKVYKTKMDEHLESCVRLDFVMDDPGFDIVDAECKDDGKDPNVQCPCCNTVLPVEQINDHLDSCLQGVTFD